MSAQAWTDPAHLARLVCRPALPIDTPTVLAFARRIWDGGDYLPEVWGEWLADSEGMLAVAEYGGRVVGTIKLTHLGAEDWWLEGLRVDPDYQGRGIANHLHRLMQQRWETNGGGILRLATTSVNVAIHHLCERDGFQRIAEYQGFAAAPLEGASSPHDAGFQPIEKDDLPEAAVLALSSGVIRKAYGLVDLGWRWAPVTLPHLQRLLAEFPAYWWRGRQGVLVLDDEDDEHGSLMSALRLAACEPTQWVDLLLDYRRMAAALGFSKCGWLAPLHPDLAPALQAAGLAPDWPFTLFIYEKRRVV